MDLIRQGASGYLNKECDPMEIVNAIRTISLGRRYFTPGVAELLARQLDRKDDVATSWSSRSAPLACLAMRSS
jgi:two-component system invasion response regulator UvrY